MRRLKTKWLVINLCSLLIPVAIVNCQSFNFQLLSDTMEYEFPGGPDIVLQGNIINTGSVDLEIDIIRAENNLPAGWQSYLCTDVCSSPVTDSSRLYLPAGQTQLFKFSFIIDATADTGNGLIKFKNVSDANNNFTHRLYGISTPYAGISTQSNPGFKVHLYPNPVVDHLMIQTDRVITELCIYNSEGKKMITEVYPSSLLSLDMEMLPAGVYFIKAIDQQGKIFGSKVIKSR